MKQVKWRIGSTAKPNKNRGRWAEHQRIQSSNQQIMQDFNGARAQSSVLTMTAQPTNHSSDQTGTFVQLSWGVARARPHVGRTAVRAAHMFAYSPIVNVPCCHAPTCCPYAYRCSVACQRYGHDDGTCSTRCCPGEVARTRRYAPTQALRTRHVTRQRQLLPCISTVARMLIDVCSLPKVWT